MSYTIPSNISVSSISSDTVTLSPSSSSWDDYTSITSGVTLTTGTNGLYWNDTISTQSVWAVDDAKKSLTVKGDAEFAGNITVNGVNLMESLEKIEQRLNILRVDPALESRWAELKELGERYRALEAECLDKEYIIEILKR